MNLHRVDARDLQVGMSVWWDCETRRVKQITRTDKGFRVLFAADGVVPERIVLLGRCALVQTKGTA